MRDIKMKKTKKKSALLNHSHGKLWTKGEVKLLKQHSKRGTRMDVLTMEFGRTPAALRNKAALEGFGLGHQQHG
jgi:hypothetical protein